MKILNFLIFLIIVKTHATAIYYILIILSTRLSNSRSIIIIIKII